MTLVYPNGERPPEEAAGDWWPGAVNLHQDPVSRTWRGDGVGTGWGNHHWFIEGMASEGYLRGRLRIRNESIPPWTLPLYDFDSGWVDFVMPMD
jgi:hypothetical protein